MYIYEAIYNIRFEDRSSGSDRIRGSNTSGSVQDGVGCCIGDIDMC